MNETAEIILGGSAAAVAGSLIVTALYYVARHTVLLFGHVTQNNDLYKFSFFVQNIEDIAFPGPVVVRILADTSGIVIDKTQIKVFSGPREIHCMVGEEAAKREPFCCAEIRFADLPPYDTWRINIQCKARSLTMKIVTDDAGSAFAKKLIKDIYPRALELNATESERASAGPTVSPNFALWAVLWPATILAYISSTIFLGRILRSTIGNGFELFQANWVWDVVALSVLSGLLWRGYTRIQRPVYPIIQGYLDDSVVRENTEVGAASQSDPPVAKPKSP
jgi:hypothetical protein